MRRSALQKVGVWTKKKSVAIGLCNRNLEVAEKIPKMNYVRLTLSDLYIYAVYVSPNVPFGTFKRTIDEILECAS